MAFDSKGVIIHGTTDPVQPNSWQNALKTAINNTQDLLDFVDLSTDHAGLADLAPAFPLRVPKGFAKLIKPGDPNDPILRQVLPLKSERNLRSDFMLDPLEESKFIPTPGLIHKYHGRVLLVVTGSCAINCRYCFRRHFPYNDNRLDSSQISRAIEYIKANPEIEEVILSGGDPLLVRDDQLSGLFERFTAIPHLKRLRIHSRTPIVIPERLTPQLCHMLVESPLQSVLVLHCNHPNEITDQLADRLQSLVAGGVTLLNQSVLLANINDNAEVLVDLSKRLFEVKIIPYYLHLLDKVQGTTHFAVDHIAARQLMGEVAAQLPGFLVPKLSVEHPGKPAKTILAPLL